MTKISKKKKKKKKEREKNNNVCRELKKALFHCIATKDTWIQKRNDFLNLSTDNSSRPVG